MFLDELNRLKIPVTEDKKFKKEETRSMLLKAIALNKTYIHENICKVLDASNSGVITTRRFRSVAVLKNGSTFGELALFHNKGRAATINCVKPTSFATLSRNDYIATLG